MQNGTLEAPAPRRTFTLDEGMVAILAEEFDYLCIAIGDEIEHAANEREGKRALDVLERQCRRLALAIVLARAVETAELDVVGLMRLDEIAELVKVSLDDSRGYLAEMRNDLAAYIIGGDEGIGFNRSDPRLKTMTPEQARRESIDEYHRTIAHYARRVAEAGRFLAVVDEWQAQARRTLED